MPDLSIPMKQPKPGPIKLNFRVSVNPAAFAELCLVLHQGEWSRGELVEKVGVVDSTVRKWIEYLHKRKLVYICEYRRRHATGSAMIYYTWNHNLEHKDVPRPRRMSTAEYSERYRQKKLRELTHLSLVGKSNHG